MKKLIIFALLCALVFMLTACVACTAHKDINGDGKCDVCFTPFTPADDDESGEEGGEEEE